MEFRSGAMFDDWGNCGRGRRLREMEDALGRESVEQMATSDLGRKQRAKGRLNRALGLVHAKELEVRGRLQASA